MSRASRGEWAASMHALHHEAAGALDLWPVLLTDVVPIMAEAKQGSRQALKLLTLVNSTLRHMQAAPPSQGPICASCSGPLHRSRFAFVVAMPAGQPRAERALSMAICAGCGTDRDTVRAAGVRAVKAAWPDAREITITHSEGGRA